MSERELFVAALHMRDTARTAFLEQACGDDRAGLSGWLADAG
jgi:hypothetical protein